VTHQTSQHDWLPKFSLVGRRALITGAGRGIGKAIAQAYAASGAEVTLCARTASEVEDAVACLRHEGYCADGLVVDINEIESVVYQLDQRASYDILVNNAGTNRPKPFQDTTPEDYDTVMNLNMRAAYFITQAVTGRMRREGKHGSIINMSSQMGHVGAPNRSLYCASKWALEGFTKALAVELGSHGIRVNAICPTFVETPMTRPMFEDKDFLNSVLNKIPLGRLAEVNDIAGVAVFLASDAAAMMNGSSVLVDGGWTAE
jgi:NAD(P)-dependent dehydrogenase (short-subunit alcohol dehydrogenase family)